MKKIIALVLILVIPAIVFYINDAEYSLRDLADVNQTDLEKTHAYLTYRFIKKDSLRVARKQKNLDPKWEYIKNTLFDHNFENRRVYFPDKLRGPILLVLKNATKQDSLAFESVMEELKTLIPTKPIAYFSDFVGTNYKTFTEGKGYKGKKIKNYSYKEITSSTLKIIMNDPKKVKIAKGIQKGADISKLFKSYRNFMWVYQNQWKYLDFVFNEDISFDERKQYIQYKLLTNICLTYPMSSRIGPNKSYPPENIFNWQNTSPWNRKFTKKDKFLIQKLYADDFEKQFSNYMYKAYSWRYASFFLNTGLAKLKAFIVAFLIGVLAFVLSFSFFQNKTFKNTYLNYLLPCLAIAIHVANLINIYLYITNMELTRYFENLMFSYLIALIVTLIYSFLLWGIEKVVIKKEFSFSYQLILKMLITYFVLNLPLLTGYIVYSTFKEEFSPMFKPESLYLPIFIALFGLTLARGLLLYLNHVSSSMVSAKEVELSRLKELYAQAETKLLQSQINPHFLYNSLNSIASLAPIDAKKTQKMAYSLSDLFKYSINRKEKKMSTIKDEIDMVKTYLEIEKIRFGDRLEFVIDIDEGLESHEMPMFLIQPLVENAVKHGVSKNEGKGEIGLKIEKADNNIFISVSDNGPNFPEGLLSGHGLQTVYDLLRLNYEDKASLNWTNAPKKAITITIPETI